MESIGIVISSMAASSIVCCVLGWLFREWISARLKKSIQHEYDVELEKFKALQRKELEGYKAGCFIDKEHLSHYNGDFHRFYILEIEKILVKQ